MRAATYSIPLYASCKTLGGDIDRASLDTFRVRGSFCEARSWRVSDWQCLPARTTVPYLGSTAPALSPPPVISLLHHFNTFFAYLQRRL